MVIGIFGYRWIHRVMQATAVVVGVSLVIMLVQGLRYGSLPAREMTMARPSAGLFLAGVALLVIDMLSFGPFVSDYTRYLPARANGRRLFWAIYAGNVLATVISCAIGAYLTALLPSLAPVAAIGKISGTWALIIMALSLVNAHTFNAYTGSFQVLAFASMWRRFKSESVTVRLIPYLCVMAVGVVIACLGYQSSAPCSPRPSAPEAPSSARRRRLTGAEQLYCGCLRRLADGLGEGGGRENHQLIHRI